MPVEVRVPEMGESIVEATVGKWLKRVGDPVTKDETLVELETEKVNLEIAAEQAGILEKVLHAEGDTVAVGEVLAIIAETVSDDGPGPAAPLPAIAPSARRLAAERGVDVSTVHGSGPRGTVTLQDVQAAAPAPAPAPVPPPAPAPATASAPGGAAPREERIRMSRRRQTIARRLVEAQQTAAMLTTFNEIDMSAVMALRRRVSERFEKRHGVKLGLMSFFTKAVIGALRAFPMLNAEIDGEEIVLKRYYNIGIAIGVESGLVVPVLRDADQMSFAEIERAIFELSQRARDNKLALADLSGGTFTITNGGVFGSLMSTPILNTPEAGVLGMHRIQDRPVAVDGQIVVRPMMYVALSYDHRLVDGRDAVQFLVRVKELVEDPGQLLIDA